MTLKGRILATLAQLGLPGQSVTVELSNGTTPFISITVPAASLVPNGTGTALGFRGTIGSASVRFKIGGRKRTSISFAARNLNLASAMAGPFTGTVAIGPLDLSAGGTLRAVGTRLRYP